MSGPLLVPPWLILLTTNVLAIELDLWRRRNASLIQDARGDIDYDEEGAGPTILFVPGSWGTRSAWRGVIAALNGRFRIVTTSLLGYGGTAERRTAADFSIDQEAEIIEIVCRRAGGCVHLVGHSYGAQVCLAVSIRGATPLMSLSLIEPTGVNVLLC